MTDTEPLMTLTELSAYLNVPAATIKDWRTRNYGPAAIKVGGRLRWRRQSVETWLAAHSEKPRRTA